MTTRIGVAVVGSDPVSEAGLVAQLRNRPSLSYREKVDDDADVVVASVALDAAGLSLLRHLSRRGGTRVVALVSDVDENGLLNLAEAGVTGLIRRSETTPELLEEVVLRAAQGETTLPPDLVGGLLRQIRQLHQNVLVPRGLSLKCLSEREVSVLSLVADGLDTRAIADELCYSERTIKNVLQDVMRRFGLKNRSHAVAFALREGYI